MTDSQRNQQRSRPPGFLIRALVGALLLCFTAQACSEQSPATRPAGYAAGPVLVRVAAAETTSFLQKLSQVPGIWGIQRHPDAYIVFMAPQPWPNTLSTLLGKFPHWDRPVRPAQLDANAQRTFAVFNALFDPPAPAPVVPGRAMPAHADALVSPELEEQGARRGLRPQSYSQVNYEYQTSEFFLGSVAIGIVLPESNGDIDASTEDWTAVEVTAVVSQITQGLMAAQAACKSCGISFVVELIDASAPGAVAGTIDTDYEVIHHPFNDINVNNNLLSRLGITGATEKDGFRQLANQLRAAHATDWAVIAKVARNTAAGNIGYAPTPPSGASLFAVTYLGGPFMALTLGNDTWGTPNLWSTFAHELNHAFYALDEYPGAGAPPTSLAGYFKVGNAGSGANNGAGFFGGAGEDDPGCIMHHTNPLPPYQYCAHTQGQIGWIDDNADGIPDVKQQPPIVTLANCGSGTAMVNRNYIYADFPPNFSPHAVGLGAIAGVEYRINQQTWLPADPQDGAFDSPSETFTVTAALPNGTYAVEARAIDSFGNVTSHGPRRLCGVSGSPFTAAAPFAALAASHSTVAQNQPLLFDASESSDLASFRRNLQYRWDWEGDAVFDTPWSSVPRSEHAFPASGTYSVVVEVRNAAALSATRAVEIEVLPVANLPPLARLRADRHYAAGSAAPSFEVTVRDSSDPEGGPLVVRWDLDGDGVWDGPVSASLTTTATFSIAASASGVFELAAEVHDSAGNTAIAYLNLRAVAYNHAPVASFAPSYLGGYTMAFDASASNDADAQLAWDQFLEYRWDFEGDGAFDTTYSTLPQISHDYGRFGTFSPTVEVRDRFRVISRKSLSFQSMGPEPTGLTADRTDPQVPELGWGEVGGAVAYRIQVATDEYFANVVADERSVTPGVSLAGLVPGTYYWRVSALSPYYDTVGFSSAAVFVLAGPGAKEVRVLPAQPRVRDSLQAEYELTDGATTAASRLYWVRDGQPVAGLENLASLPAGTARKNEIWRFVVTPANDLYTGAAIASAPVQILNTPPKLDAASVQAEGSELLCSPGAAHDDDGDEVQYQYAWTRNDVILPETGVRLHPETAGMYVCSVTPSDEELAGEPVSSAAYQVTKARPSGDGGGCNSTTAGGAFWVVGLVGLGLLKRCFKAVVAVRQI